MGTILVRYGELALKSRPVRLRFERTLIRNIEDLFVHAGEECLVERQWGRILLFAKDDKRAGAILSRAFGVTSFSPAEECGSGRDEVAKVAAERSRDLLRKGQSFAVRARRTGSHGYTSQELAARVGTEVLQANEGKGIKVNLSEPDVELFVEVRQKKAYVFVEKLPGPGGLPLGTQGRVVALLDGQNGAVAAWMMMKRGCRVIAVGDPGSGCRVPGAGDDAQRALEMLLPWVPELKLHRIVDISIGGLARFARRRRAEAIVLGRTYDGLDRDIPKAAIPVLFPLCGLSQEEVGAMARKMGR